MSSRTILLLSAASLLLACDADGFAEVDSYHEDAPTEVDLRSFKVKPYPGGGGCEGCGASDELSNGGSNAATQQDSAEQRARQDGDTEECDLRSQDCPEGEKCTAWADDGGARWNATRCSPIAPSPAQPGDVCTAEGGGVSGVDNCGQSSMCWDVDAETGEGVCVALCVGDNADDGACESGFACSTFNDGVLSLCLPDCDMLLQDCPGDSLCIPSGDHFACVLDASGDTGLDGDPCEYANSCKPGRSCITAELVEGRRAGGFCTPFCDTTKRSSCGSTQECIPWYEESDHPGAEDLGICGIRR